MPQIGKPYDVTEEEVNGELELIETCDRRNILHRVYSKDTINRGIHDTGNSKEKEKKRGNSKLPRIFRKKIHQQIDKNVAKSFGLHKNSGDTLSGRSSPPSPSEKEELRCKTEKAKHVSYIPRPKVQLTNLHLKPNEKECRDISNYFTKETNIQRLHLPNLSPDWFKELDTPVNSLESNPRNTQLRLSSDSADTDQSVVNVGYRSLSVRNQCLDENEVKQENSSLAFSVTSEFEALRRANNIVSPADTIKALFKDMPLMVQQTIVIERENKNYTVVPVESLHKIDKSLAPIVMSRKELCKNLQFPSKTDPDTKREKQVIAPSYVDYPSEMLQRTTNFENDGNFRESSKIGYESPNTVSSVDETDVKNHEDYSKQYFEQADETRQYNKASDSQDIPSQNFKTVVMSNGSGTETKVNSNSCIYHKDIDASSHKHQKWQPSTLRGNPIFQFKKYTEYRRFPSRRYKMTSLFNSPSKRSSIRRIYRHRLDYAYNRSAVRCNRWSKLRTYNCRIVQFLKRSIEWDDVDIQTLTQVFQETGTHTNVMKQKSTEITASMKSTSNREYSEKGTAGTSVRSFKSRFKNINLGPSRFFYDSMAPTTLTTDTLTSPINLHRLTTMEHNTETESVFFPVNVKLTNIMMSGSSTQRTGDIMSKEASTQILLSCKDIETDISFAPVFQSKSVENVSYTLPYHKPIGINTDSIALETCLRSVEKKSVQLMTSQIDKNLTMTNVKPNPMRQSSRFKNNWAKQWYLRSRKIKPIYQSSLSNKKPSESTSENAVDSLKDFAVRTSSPHLTMTGVNVTAISSAQMLTAAALTSITNMKPDNSYNNVSKMCVECNTAPPPMCDRSQLWDRCSDVKHNLNSSQIVINSWCQTTSTSTEKEADMEKIKNEKCTFVMPEVAQKSTGTVMSECKQTQSTAFKDQDTEPVVVYSHASTYTSVLQRQSVGQSVIDIIRNQSVSTIDTWVQCSQVGREKDKQSLRSARIGQSYLISERTLNDSFRETFAQAQPSCNDMESRYSSPLPFYTYHVIIEQTLDAILAPASL